MMRRTRHVLFAWLAYGALQLTLLGVGGLPGSQASVADRGTRTQSTWPSVSFAKRLLAPEPTERRTSITPFAPAAYVGVDIPAIAGHDAPQPPARIAVTFDRTALPPARAPPARA